MSSKRGRDRFDALLLSQARLAIVSALITRNEVSFSGLKQLLGLTQGNLGLHLRKLEEAGYVKITKDFVERKPRTTVALSKQGRLAFLNHVDQLRRIAEGEDTFE